MRRAIALGAAALLVALLAGSSPSQASSPPPDRSNPPPSRPLDVVRLADGREAVAGQFIVRFRDDVTPSRRASLHTAARALGALQAAEVGPAGPAFVVRTLGSVERAVHAYRSLPEVVYAEPDLVLRVDYTPNDPLRGSQWTLTTIDAYGAWDVTKGSTTVSVAILDSGIYEAGSSSYPGHPDLNGKVVKRANFSGMPDLDDWYDHGTHVAGIVAASTDNGTGVAGVGFNTTLFNVKVCTDWGTCATSATVNGIYWAADRGARVINMSLGGPGACTSSEQEAINYAVKRSVVVVAAAGNDATSSVTHPASCAKTLAVAATDASDGIADFSNYGTWVELAAPGVDIYSTDYIGGYEYLTGTSMAAPVVSGVAALVWTTSWGTSATSVMARIKATADAITGTGTLWEAGRVNANAAVQPPSLPCASPTLSADPVSPQAVGTAIEWTAAADACDEPEYQFQAKAPGSTSWNVLQDWSSDATATWDTTGLKAGTWGVRVNARRSGLTATDVKTATTFDLQTGGGGGGGGACTDAALSPDPASPQDVGTTVTWTASSSGCGSPQYKFFAKAPGSTSFSAFRDWSSTATADWDTAGKKAGTWTIQVKVRRAGTTTVDDSATATYELQSGGGGGGGGACTDAGLAADPASPQLIGAVVTWTASSSGCSSPEYKFLAKPPGSTSFSAFRNWSSTATADWDTTGRKAGIWTIQVKVQRAGMTTVDTKTTASYELQK